jgi:uncharacterized protein
MKIVLDTNILISSLIASCGHSAQILSYNLAFTAYSTEEILAEFERVVRYDRIQKRHKLSDKEIKIYLKRVRAQFIVVPVKLKSKLVRDDMDDNKFIACAKQVSANYIVSGDPHLLKIKEYKGMKIVPQAEFQGI